MGYVDGYIWIIGGVGFVVGRKGVWGGLRTTLNRINNNRSPFEMRSPIG